MRQAFTNFGHLRARAAQMGVAAAMLALLTPGASAGQRILHGAQSDAAKCHDAVRRADHASAGHVAACTAVIADEHARDSERAAARVNRATLYRHLGEDAAAVADCEAALPVMSREANVAISCAAVFIDAGEPDRAVELLQQSELPETRDRYKYYHNLALAHHDLGEYSLAYYYLEKTLAAKPGFAPAVELIANYKVVED